MLILGCLLSSYFNGLNRFLLGQSGRVLLIVIIRLGLHAHCLTVTLTQDLDLNHLSWSFEFLLLVLLWLTCRLVSQLDRKSDPLSILRVGSDVALRWRKASFFGSDQRAYRPSWFKHLLIDYLPDLFAFERVTLYRLEFGRWKVRSRRLMMMVDGVTIFASSHFEVRTWCRITASRFACSLILENACRKVNRTVQAAWCASVVWR